MRRAVAQALKCDVTRGQTVDWNSSWAHSSSALAVLRWSWLLSQITWHGSGIDGRTGLHQCANPLERQGRFAPQPGGNGLKKSAVDLQALTTIQQNNITSQRAPARVPITLTVCVTPHPSTTSRQHYFHGTAPLYMERRIFAARSSAVRGRGPSQTFLARATSHLIEWQESMWNRLKSGNANDERPQALGASRNCCPMERINKMYLCYV